MYHSAQFGCNPPDDEEERSLKGSYRLLSGPIRGVARLGTARAPALGLVFALASARPAPAAAACVIGDANGTPSIVITASPPDCCYGTWAGSV